MCCIIRDYGIFQHTAQRGRIAIMYFLCHFVTSCNVLLLSQRLFFQTISYTFVEALDTHYTLNLLLTKLLWDWNRIHFCNGEVIKVIWEESEYPAQATEASSSSSRSCARQLKPHNVVVRVWEARKMEIWNEMEVFYFFCLSAASLLCPSRNN